ncbi:MULTISPECIES: MCE family protein [Mycolicibacterium]|nr:MULTISPECIES: MCE family protein [Mycolicibacterium]ABP43141.1 virulence factor Mce family protein [Mycolicibacterium gilvum PYR-GCK]ABM11345.1 virulence factor Mce family protein [Mycolicibacterium vanbaalenii PYR-1]ADT96898.1 virulence factor Mce family protein [Mycolicibacterium gilvum Spyr1]MBV5246942.1 MCE family protein [Mycolicibacterium sp. PAM1]MCV7155826.1 MCE family protein [Mycolicibacterium pyrenivorans]
MADGTGARRISPGWWAMLLVTGIVAAVVLSLAMFNRTFTPTVPVTLTADRSGLMLEPNSRVKMRGVQIGRVSAVTGGDAPRIQLAIDPDQIRHIPANVEARIQSISLFGAKYVDLVYPPDPSPQRLSAGAVLTSQNTATEVNTVFQNVVQLIKTIDPLKLNAVLSALAEGVRGQGDRIGEAITASNQVLLELNPRTDTVREDFRALKGVSDTYSAAAKDIIDTVAAATTTSATVTTHAQQLDTLLLNVVGLSRSGIDLLGASKDNLVKAVNLLEPTTNLLMKYNPMLTCLFVGAKTTLDTGYADMLGGNGKSLIMDAALLLGDDPYRYPDHRPINAAKGGEGGKPSCGSLPDVAQNFPVRQLIANTGFGTGLDWRPNPGIGFPGYANYFPVTRAVPEPPSIRYPGGPAPGPMPYPGAPPYGAPQYGPDGTPLYPGVPVPPPPSAGPTP